MKIGIIGAGRVGGALAIALSKRNFPVYIASRHKENADFIASISNARSASIKYASQQCDVVLLTVTDSAIKSVAEQIASFLNREQVVMHTSGALSSKIISLLNAHTGSLHPLKSFANSQDAAKSLEGTIFTFEGSKKAETVAREIVKALKGKFVKINSKDKVLYHLAAVLTANYTVTLFSLSQEILESIGFSDKDAKESLSILLKGVAKNIEKNGADNALTGPILRGDAETIKMHLNAIKDKNIRDIYISLAFATLKTAGRRGLDKRKIDLIRKVLNGQNYRT